MYTMFLRFMKPPRGINNKAETNNGSESPPPGGERKKRLSSGAMVSARTNRRRSFSFRVPPHTVTNNGEEILKKRELGDHENVVSLHVHVFNFYT